MRIFKNRGDIYFSKSNKEKSVEQKILLIALIVIIAFTVIFVLALSIKNDFSAKKFFAPENVSLSETVTENEIQELPEVSGKNNFMTIVHKNENLLFTALIQVDMDNPSYKVSILKADTEIEKNLLKDIYSQSGAENVKNAIVSYFGIDIDYYISMDSSDFSSFFNSLGEVNYPILNEIKHREKNSPVNYTLKIKAGEQRIDGNHFINLMRYYIDTENSISQANDLFLAALSQQLNSKNFEDKEDLFKTFVTVADTDITIRDFSTAGDELSVICSDMAAMSVYNAEAKYNGNKIDSENLKSIKSYFVK